MAEVITCMVTYRGSENRVWRAVQISSNSYLSKLAYTIMASFNTFAYHLFMFSCHGEEYDLPDGEFDLDLEENVFNVKLADLVLRVGDRIEMLYDFGCCQYFDIKVLKIEPMARGTGNTYPKIIAGVGAGIIEDLGVEEFMELIHAKEEGRKANLDFEECDLDEDWVYQTYDVDKDNKMLKSIIADIERGYTS